MNRKEATLTFVGAGGKMRKTVKQILVVLTFFALFIGIYPQMVEASGVDEIPRIVFENEKNAQPDLYITKNVESIDERYQAPTDDEFDFTLRIDEDLANEMAYRVFNEEGDEVYLYDDGESTEVKSNKIPYKTNRSGGFTLKSGQTALFEYVGIGKSYEVTEDPKEKYIQTLPAGGTAAVGTIPRDGVGVYFTNTYIPDGSQPTTTLQVQKQIAYPSAYDLPETPDFTFVLKLRNAVYAYENYTIVNLQTGATEGSGVTDADGKFTLKGGQSAVFTEVSTDVDYQVTEESTPGWRAVGQTTLEGATQSPITLASFTNANASFGVRKQMENNEAVETEFTFVLTDEGRRPMVGIEYYLYTNSGVRLYADAVEPFVTDANGKFTLLPGQTAIFVGVELDTIYNVYEEVREGFIQQLPLAADGYTNKQVSDAVEILPFVNKQRDTQGNLSITKRVVIEGEEGSNANPTFTFVLSKLEDGEYVPVADAVYGIEVGGTESTYKTNSKGEFTLKRNETVTFKALEAGTTYRVEEINLPISYTIDEAIKEGELTQNSLYFTFTNVYEKEEYKVDLVIHKQNNAKELLSGARFALYKNKDLTQMVGSEITTGESGKISYEDLELGTYYLVEKQSPTGYQLLINPVEIELYNHEGSLAVKVNGKIHTSTDDTKGIYMTLNPEENDAANIIVFNQSGFKLPFTGSGGFTIAVMVLLIGITLLYRSMFNKKNKSTERK